MDTFKTTVGFCTHTALEIPLGFHSILVNWNLKPEIAANDYIYIYKKDNMEMQLKIHTKKPWPLYIYLGI